MPLMLATNKETGEEIMDFEEDEEELENGWEDWEGDEDAESNFVCLFCHFRYSSCLALFDHCSSAHHFNFQSIRKNLCLDFYGSFKLINFVRSQVHKVLVLVVLIPQVLKVVATKMSGQQKENQNH